MRIVSFVLLFCLAAWQQSLAQSKRKLDSLEALRLRNFKKIEELRQTIISTARSKEITLSDYQTRKVLLNRYREDIHIVRQQLKWFQEQIAETQQLIEMLQEDEKSLRKDYNNILYELSKIENQAKNSVAHIFSVDSWNEMRQRKAAYEQLEKSGREKLQAIEATVRKLTERKKQLAHLEEARLAAETSLKSDIEFEEKQRQELEARLKQLQKREAEFLAHKQRLEHFNEQITKEINEIANRITPASPTAENTSLSVAKNNGREAAEKREAEMKSAPAGIIRNDVFAEHKSLLPWPVDRFNYFIPFGIQSYPGMPHIEYENLGIEISTMRNEPVKSIFEGTVVGVKEDPTIGGWVVIVRHDDYISIYARLQNVTVKKNARIKARTVLGTVGVNQDGYAMLHFQIWKHRQNLNPEDWLAKNVGNR